MKYRKKPVEILAVQLLDTDDSIRECQQFIENSIITLPTMAIMEKWEEYLRLVRKQGGIRLKTLESDNETQIANFGDFIIKGVKGENYPCKPGIFELTYEKVEE